MSGNRNDDVHSVRSDAASNQPPADGQARQIDPRLLEILVCPMTKGPLEYKSDSQELISYRADLAFPIRNGVPLMTPQAARALTDAERARSKATKR